MRGYRNHSKYEAQLWCHAVLGLNDMIRSVHSCVYVTWTHFANTHGEDIVKLNNFTVDTTKYISIQILSPIEIFEIPHAFKMKSFPSTVLATQNSHQTDHDDIQPVKL